MVRSAELVYRPKRDRTKGYCKCLVAIVVLCSFDVRKPMSEHRKPLAPPPNISVRESPLAASPRNKGISKAIPARITPSMLPWISEYTLTDNHIVFKILECPTLQHPVGQGCQPCNELKRACIIREGFTLCASCSARGSRAAKCGFGIPLQSGRWYVNMNHLYFLLISSKVWIRNKESQRKDATLLEGTRF